VSCSVACSSYLRYIDVVCDKRFHKGIRIRRFHSENSDKVKSGIRLIQYSIKLITTFSMFLIYITSGGSEQNSKI
jgi:hypothetical protein